MQDRRARYHELLSEGMSRFMDGLVAGSDELVRDQIEATEQANCDAAALACLAAAEAVGGAALAALPGAIAVALVEQMGRVFSSLENAEAGLSTAWGMPRALNAGDAMFALAQEAILTASNELTATERLAAAALIDRGGRDLMDALYGAGGSGVASKHVLLPVALELGALLGGAGVQGRQRLAELGRRWSDLSKEERSRKLASDPTGWLAT